MVYKSKTFALWLTPESGQLLEESGLHGSWPYLQVEAGRTNPCVTDECQPMGLCLECLIGIQGTYVNGAKRLQGVSGKR